MECGIKALEELNLYEENGLCLIPSDVYEKQCKELDRLKEERLRRNTYINDTLFVGVDFSQNDEEYICKKAYEKFYKHGKRDEKLLAAMVNAGFPYKMAKEIMNYEL